MDAILHKRPEPVVETLALLYIDGKQEALRGLFLLQLGVSELQKNEEDIKRERLHADYMAAFSARRRDNADSDFLFRQPDIGSYLVPALCFLLHRELLYDAASLPREELTAYLRESFAFLQDTNLMFYADKEKDWDDFLAADEWLSCFSAHITESFSALAFLVRENIPAAESAWNQISPGVQPYLGMQSFQEFTERSTLAEGAKVRECYPLLSIFTSSFIVGDVFYYGLFSVDHRPAGQRGSEKQQLCDMCRAIGDKNRMEILYLLRQKPRYNRELAKLLGLTPATATHHLDILFQCGLIKMTTESDNQKRIYYEINPQKARQCVALLEKMFDIYQI